MKKLIAMIFMFIIASNSYYGIVNEEGERITSFENTTQESKTEENTEDNQENVTEEIIEENTSERNVAQTDITQNNEQEKVKQNQQTKTTIQSNVNVSQNKNLNTNSNNAKMETGLVSNNIQKQEQTNQTKQQEVQQNTTTQQNEAKYVRNEQMIQKIRSVIESNVTEDMKNYGYTIVVDSSIKSLTNQFTFTESRVKNNIRYSFGTIRIYAEDYYSNGQLIMTECYIL